MNRPLTKKQKQVLDFIRDFIEMKSYPPIKPTLIQLKR